MFLITLMMQAASTSEKITRRDRPEDGHLHAKHLNPCYRQCDIYLGNFIQKQHEHRKAYEILHLNK
jgi:hypothetical protein